MRAQVRPPRRGSVAHRVRSGAPCPARVALDSAPRPSAVRRRCESRAASLQDLKVAGRPRAGSQARCRAVGRDGNVQTWMETEMFVESRISERKGKQG